MPKPKQSPKPKQPPAVMDPDEFIKKYSPTNNSRRKTWAQEISYYFTTDREWRRIMKTTRSVAERGIQTPVRIRNNMLVNGHHRVAAALLTGKPIPIEYVKN